MERSPSSDIEHSDDAAAPNTLATRPAFLPAGSSRCWSAALRLFECLHDLIDAEARWCLPRRKLLECADELRHQRLRRHRQERQLEHPVVVGVRRDIGPLVWV